MLRALDEDVATAGQTLMLQNEKTFNRRNIQNDDGETENLIRRVSEIFNEGSSTEIFQTMQQVY
jgi:hypothetical protein